MCPVAITYGVVPMLRQEPSLAEQWERLLLSPDYGKLPPGMDEETILTRALAA